LQSRANRLSEILSPAGGYKPPTKCRTAPVRFSAARHAVTGLFYWGFS